jgi:probable phosphomutase (TIGR03848 family)
LMLSAACSIVIPSDCAAFCRSSYVMFASLPCPSLGSPHPHERHIACSFRCEGRPPLSFRIVPTLLLLIRHALTDTAGKRLSGWQRGVHLNDEGRREADRLVERLAPVRIDAIYSSSLERCVETATPVAKAKGLAVERVPGLRDVDYGDWSGRSMRQVTGTKQWRRIMRDPSGEPFPGGETLRGVQARVLEELGRIAAAHPRAAVAVVTHADPVRLALAHYGGAHIDLFQRLVVHPASTSAVLVGDGMPRILRVNDIGDLSDLTLPPPRGRGSGGKPGMRT